MALMDERVRQLTSSFSGAWRGLCHKIAASTHDKECKTSFRERIEKQLASGIPPKEKELRSALAFAIQGQCLDCCQSFVGKVNLNNIPFIHFACSYRTTAIVDLFASAMDDTMHPGVIVDVGVHFSGHIHHSFPSGPVSAFDVARKYEHYLHTLCLLNAMKRHKNIVLSLGMAIAHNVQPLEEDSVKPDSTKDDMTEQKLSTGLFSTLPQELLTLRKYHKKAKSKKRQTESSAHEMQEFIQDYHSRHAQADQVLLTVIGKSCQGKTTLLDSIAATQPAFFRNERSKGAGRDGDNRRTRGIDVRNILKVQGKPIRVQELGGQVEFCPVHCLFCSFASGARIVYIVVSLRDSSIVADSLHRACGSIASLCVRGNSQVRPVTFIVFTNADEKDKKFEVDEPWKTATAIMGQYDQFLDFKELHFVNALKSSSAEMKELRRSTISSAEDILEMVKFPAGVVLLRTALQAVRKQMGKNTNVVSWNEFGPALLHSLFPSFSEFIGEEVVPQLIQKVRDMTKDARRILSTYAEIVTFEDSPIEDLNDKIVLNPSWLLKDIVGRLSAPRAMKIPMPRVEFDRGRVSMTDFIKNITTGNDGKMIMEKLRALGLIVRDGDDIIYPPFLCEPEPGTSLYGGWKSDSKLVLYIGRLFKSDKCTPFSFGLVTQTQTAVRRHFAKEHECPDCEMHRDTISVGPYYYTTRGCIRFHPGLTTVSIIVRGERNEERSMFALLHILRKQLIQQASEFSPGTIFNEEILSNRELSEHFESVPVRHDNFTTYSRDHVRESLKGNRKLSPKWVDKALEVLDLPENHIHLFHSDTKSRLCEILTSDRTIAGELLRKNCIRKSTGGTDIFQSLEECGAHLTSDWLLEFAKRRGREEIVQLMKEEIGRPFVRGVDMFQAERPKFQSKDPDDQTVGVCNPWREDSFQSHRRILIHHCDKGELRVRCFGKGLIDHRFKTSIKDYPMEEHNERVFGYLAERGTAKTYCTFLEVVEDMGKAYLFNSLKQDAVLVRSNYDGDNPWDNPAFKKHYEYFAFFATMECDIRPLCYEKDLITNVKNDELLKIQDTRAHNEALLDALWSDGVRSYAAFLDILEEVRCVVDDEILEDLRTNSTYLRMKPAQEDMC